jgi:eukaryotic-like serine/threonine-protein kinase
MEPGIMRLRLLDADADASADGASLRDTMIDRELGERGDASLPPGARLGRYIILERVGHGGMGVVYAAFDPELSRRVALKVLYPEASRADGSSGSARARMQREAQAMARVSHPNVISVFDVGVVDTLVFVAMEFVQGATLRQWLAGAPRSFAEIVAIFVQAGRGLEAAHAAGLVHRDFKPDNVIVGDDGLTRVLDFGLARTEASLGSGEADDRRLGPFEALLGGTVRLEPSDMLGSQLTQAGAIVGTPSYMAPEQHAGVAADGRSDQFSFCVALYEALYRQPPFVGATPELLVRAKQRGEVRPAAPEHAVPTHLATVVLRGLAVDPDQRWPDMRRLVDALGRDPAAGRRSRLRMVGVAAIAAGIAGGAAMLVNRDEDPCAGSQQALVGIWDDARHRDVRDAMLAVDVPYAQATATHVERALDDYTADWIAARVEACTATQVRHEQSPALLDRRMACLDARMHAVAALVDVLAHADARAVEHADQATRVLPALAACANSDYLLASVEPPPPESAAAVDEVRQQLASARALMNAGRVGESAELARLAHAQALTIEYAPLLAETLARLGATEEAQGEFEAAKQRLMEALTVALAHHHDESAAGTAQRLIGVIGGHLAQHEEGLRWAAVARSIYQRLGLDGDAELAGAIDLAEANLHFQMGAYRRAGATYEQAIATIEREHGREDTRLIQQLTNLGSVLVREERLPEALATYERAGSIAEAQLGPGHPHLGVALAGAAHALSDMGEPDRAEAKQLAANEIFRAALGDDHPNVIAGECNLGIFREAKGDLAAALVRFEHCHARQLALYGPDHPEVGRALFNLGRIRSQLGELEQGRLDLDRALVIQRATLGPTHDSIATTLVELGEVDLREHAPRAALARFTEGLELVERAGLGGAMTGHVRFAWARASRLADGPNPRARHAAQRARAEIASQADAAEPLREIDAWLASDG